MTRWWNNDEPIWAQYANDETMNNDKQTMICWHFLFSELPMNIICFSSCVHPSLVSTENNRKICATPWTIMKQIIRLMKWFRGVAGSLKSAGGEQTETVFSTRFFFQNLPIGLVCGYTCPILHTCQHCVSKAWSTYTNTHIFIYVQTFVMEGPLLSWGCRKLEISWGWTLRNASPNPPPQSLPIGLVCGYTWPILHTCQHCVSKAWSTYTNTHIFIYIYIDLHPGSIGAFLGLPEAWNQLGVNT